VVEQAHTAGQREILLGSLSERGLLGIALHYAQSLPEGPRFARCKPLPLALYDSERTENGDP
jgi:hypothetical protein